MVKLTNKEYFELITKADEHISFTVANRVLDCLISVVEDEVERMVCTGDVEAIEDGCGLLRYIVASPDLADKLEKCYNNVDWLDLGSNVTETIAL